MMLVIIDYLLLVLMIWLVPEKVHFLTPIYSLSMIG